MCIINIIIFIIIKSIKIKNTIINIINIIIIKKIIDLIWTVELQIIISVIINISKLKKYY